MKMFRKDEGFTLVELMVVVLIIGILIAIAIPVFNSARNRAERNSCYSNQRMIEGAVQTYYASVETTPANIAALVPNYIKETPECPTLDVAYTIDANGDVFCSGTAGCDTHGRYDA
jgi:type IV pilus assembly protein PilA